MPVVPWSGSDLFLPKEECENGRCGIEVSNELRMAACVSDHEEAIRIMKVFGFAWFISNIFNSCLNYTDIKIR